MHSASGRQQMNSVRSLALAPLQCATSCCPRCGGCVLRISLGPRFHSAAIPKYDKIRSLSGVCLVSIETNKGSRLQGKGR